jgi:31-O-methyltransferase
MKYTENKKFWTIDNSGSYVLRDLDYEARFWFDKRNGNYDSSKVSDPYNSCWFEIFDFYECGSDGCDYERFGCQILPGDIVLDIGGNIGIFAHRAEVKGASCVYSFEPMTKTFHALSMNAGERTRVFKNAIFSEQRILNMSIPDSELNTGGGSLTEILNSFGRTSALQENVVSLEINSLFKPEMIGKIDFIKMDIEGAEIQCLDAISDENLSSIRCLAAEFHRTIPEMDSFRERFIKRCSRLGFTHFTNYYSCGTQMTVNIWK